MGANVLRILNKISNLRHESNKIIYVHIPI